MTTLLTTTTPQRHRARFHALTVSAVERLTDDAVAVSFAVPQDLADEFVFAPGQHLTLRATIEGQDTRRSYSICRSPQEVRRLGELRVAASRVEGGLMSSWLNDTVRVGDTVQVMTPLGSFVCPHRPRRGPSPRRDRRRLGHHPGDVAARHGAGAGARVARHARLRQPADQLGDVPRGAAGPQERAIPTGSSWSTCSPARCRTSSCSAAGSTASGWSA